MKNSLSQERAELLDTLTALSRSGWLPVSVDDGDGVRRPAVNPAAVDEAVFAVDDSRVYFRNAESTVTGWLSIVRGNGPGYLVCDYSNLPGFSAAVDGAARAHDPDADIEFTGRA